MTNIGKRWAGVSLVVSLFTLGAGAAQAQAQYIQGDVWQYQRDQQQTGRDYYQLNRDVAVGNLWGVQRDVANLQRDQQNLSIDRQNIRDDLRFNTAPYPTTYGAYPQAPCRQQPTSWGGPPYPGVGLSYPGAGPYGPAGAGGFPVYRPW